LKSAAHFKLPTGVPHADDQRIALALTWYTLNPVPATLQLSKREDNPPDTKQRQNQPAGDLYAVRVAPAFSPADANRSSFDEPFDWPEYLDLD
jgi:hypothetical protein